MINYERRCGWVTEKQAMKYADKLRENAHGDMFNFLVIAQNAIDKQIEKKVKSDFEDTLGICPSCCKDLLDEEAEYCQWCGQKLKIDEVFE